MSGGGNPTAAQASSSFLRSAIILPVIVSIMAVVVLAITVLLPAVVYAVSIGNHKVGEISFTKREPGIQPICDRPHAP